jgi:hypothetical protein
MFNRQLSTLYFLSKIPRLQPLVKVPRGIRGKVIPGYYFPSGAIKVEKNFSIQLNKYML